MFNGIIFNQGLVKKITKKKSGINLFLKSNLKIAKKDIGISVSCDGTCLTLINIKNKLMEFYLSKETIKRSKFKNVEVGNSINLELPLKYGKNISGHFIQGHVDCTAKVCLIKKIDKSYLFNFIIKDKDKKSLVEKASIAINGISLTVSKITKAGFQTWIIPHTLKLTNFSKIKKNDLVNIEIDILSKYVKKYLNAK